jgi:hypothetical protein
VSVSVDACAPVPGRARTRLSHSLATAPATPAELAALAALADSGSHPRSLSKSVRRTRAPIRARSSKVDRAGWPNGLPFSTLMSATFGAQLASATGTSPFVLP